MIKGLYSAASAMIAGVNRQSLLAHNAANMDTPGFKQFLVSLDDFVQTSVVQPPAEASSTNQISWVGELGLGVETAPEEVDFTSGGMQFTGQALDFALQGSGFFRIKTPDGERYTRDGRFILDTKGQLVNVDGNLVLDDGGQPITLEDDTGLTVSADGTMYVNGEEVSKLGIASFADPDKDLTRDTPNSFSATGQPNGSDKGIVAQGYLEGSNVNTAQLMTQMVQVARNYEAAQQMAQSEDELTGKTISTLGRL
jgi:flagellar basal-body rod protein FlgF